MNIDLQCHLGSEVELQVGGDFCYNPKPGDSQPDLLLIAGGIGINPLFSIVQHAADLLQGSEAGDVVAKLGSVVLLYSAKSKLELIHRVYFK